MDFTTEIIPSPIGALQLTTCDDEVVGVDFEDSHERGRVALQRWFPQARFRPRPEASRAGAVLARYFTDPAADLGAIPIRLGGSDFQRSVWLALRGIGRGSVTSYAEIARRVERPAAVRAVGAANGANPIPVILPCHRVVGSDGSLTGFGGGLPRKRWLLAHEGATAGLLL
jgi:O-6-methylguanine DNA methyltransferase